MKNPVFWKAALRQPVRMALLCVLLGLLSFASVSRGVEFLSVNNAISRTETSYRAIGTLNSEDNPEADATEAAILLRESGHVVTENYPKSAPAMLDGCYNADTDGAVRDLFVKSDGTRGISPYDVLFSGVFLSAAQVGEEWMLMIQVDSVLMGFPEYIQPGDMVRVYAKKQPEKLKANQRILLRVCYDSSRNVLAPLEDAEQYMNLASLPDGHSFLPLNAGEEIDLDAPKFAGIREQIQLLENQMRAVSLLGTADMSALPEMQPSAQQNFLVEGRWLDTNDTREQSPICVIPKILADTRGIRIGDSLPITYRNLSSGNLYGYSLPDTDSKEILQAETESMSLTVVGIYDTISTSNVPRMTVYGNMIYVPESCLPETFIWETSILSADFYSFVLDSIRNQAEFAETYGPQLEEMGLTLEFVENGGQNFLLSAEPMQQSSLAGTLVFGGLFFLVTGCVIFLYLWQRRQEFAILRALGVPRKQVVRDSVLPFLLPGCVVILLGGAAGWFWAEGKASELLALLPSDSNLGNLQNSPLWLVGFLLIGVLFLVAAVFVEATVFSRRPVLEQLQGTFSFKKKGKKQEFPLKDMTSDAVPGFSGLAVPDFPRTGNYKGALCRLSVRMSIRSTGRSLLSVLTAAAFLLALGMMSRASVQSQTEIDRLYRTTPVELQILRQNSSSTISSGGFGSGFIRPMAVENVLESGFAESAVLHGEVTCTGLYRPDEEKPFYGQTVLHGWNCVPDSVHISFASGWSEQVFADELEIQTKNVPVFLPLEWRDMTELQDGQKILLQNFKGSDKRPAVIAGWYQSQETDGILLPLSALQQMTRGDLAYSQADFQLNPEKNRELDSLREFLKPLEENSSAGLLPLRFQIWDDELRQSIQPLEKNLQIIRVLLPVTYAAAALIGAGLAVFLSFLHIKNAAILRVLGVSRRNAARVLILSGMLAVIIGCLIGMIAAIILAPEGIAGSLLGAALYLAGSLVGTVLGAVRVTGRRPLELLQAKE